VHGGVFAGQMFGLRDSWADSPRMRFCSLEQAGELLVGLEILDLGEAAWDGEAASGPKHWHVLDVLVRQPPGFAG